MYLGMSRKMRFRLGYVLGFLSGAGLLSIGQLGGWWKLLSGM